MDVLHRQVEEHGGEIRFINNAKSPKMGRSWTPRRSDMDHLRENSGNNLQNLAWGTSVGAFEASLFRPALQAARKDAAQWKAKATISSNSRGDLASFAKWKLTAATASIGGAPNDWSTTMTRTAANRQT